MGNLNRDLLEELLKVKGISPDFLELLICFVAQQEKTLKNTKQIPRPYERLNRLINTSYNDIVLRGAKVLSNAQAAYREALEARLFGPPSWKTIFNDIWRKLNA